MTKVPDYGWPYLPRWLRLFGVAVVDVLWAFMPRRAKTWAFLNDDMPEE